MSEKNPLHKKTQVRNYYTVDTKANIHQYIAHCLRTDGKEKSFSKACEDLIEMGLKMHSIQLAAKDFANTEEGRKANALLEKAIEEAMKEGEKYTEGIKAMFPKPKENSHNK